LKRKGIILLIIISLIPIFPAFAQIDKEDYISMNNPSELIWTGKKFIVSSEEEGIIKLYSIDPCDKIVNRFGPTFAGRDEVHFVSSSGAYFPSENVYATSGDTISEISPEGDTTRVFATPSQGSNIVGLAFDVRGYWNYRLLAVTADGSVWEVDINGDVDLVADLGDNVVPNGIEMAPDEFGDFQGHILIPIKAENRILTVSHKEDHSVNLLTEIPGENPLRLVYINTRSGIYVSDSDDGKIIILDRDLVKDNLAQVMVITENSVDRSISLYAIKSARAGVDVTNIISDVEDLDFDGITFVFDIELTDVLECVEEDETEPIDPLFIIIPVLAIIVIIFAIVFWRYRGF
jgi:hypothetical protein